MNKELENMSTTQLIDAHFALYGATFSRFVAIKLDKNDLDSRLRKAIANSQPLTDEDLGVSDLPDGALI